MVAGPAEYTWAYFFTNRKLPSIHSEPVLRSRSNASSYTYAEKNSPIQNVSTQVSLRGLRRLTCVDTFCSYTKLEKKKHFVFQRFHIFQLYIPVLNTCRADFSIKLALYWISRYSMSLFLVRLWTVKDGSASMPPFLAYLMISNPIIAGLMHSSF